MKKLFISLSLMTMALGVFAKDIQELIVTTNPLLSCQNCENKIKKNLRFEKGVTKIETNIPDQRVVVTYDADKTNPEKIAEGFAKIGYTVMKINNCCYPPSECCKENAPCCQPQPIEQGAETVENKETPQACH